MNNKILLTAVIVTCILSFTFLRYQSVAVANKNRAESNNQLMLDQCIVNVEEAYKSNWDGNCLDIGRETKCSLPEKMAQAVEDVRKVGINICLTRWAK